MKLLVLGGTRHVGRAVVEEAVERGDDVTVVNRGTHPPGAGARARVADRREPGSLAAALGADSWDAVVDTWAAEPVVVRDAARLLEGRVGHLTYVSSRSVYAWPIPIGADESAAVVDADPDSTDPDAYAEAKRGAELAIAREFTGPALVLRAGLILGPWEFVGRMPWWLTRIAAGGAVAAPGPPERPLQYIDARDLAAWALRCAEGGTAGVFNTVSPVGHATISEVLDACIAATGSEAELVWRTPEQVEAAGLEGWTDLPIWTPPTGELAALHDGDVSAALAAGLTCRPIAETVADTWTWLQREGMPPAPPGRPMPGMTADQEATLLALV
ncbi:MAG: NAD-dependent epimerase/dehydratase family protein [Marmoricola sp.]|nr:NAD-dependent epimerase/dehydratase family protein [Marmoricola sp.]